MVGQQHTQSPLLTAILQTLAAMHITNNLSRQFSGHGASSNAFVLILTSFLELPLQPLPFLMPLFSTVFPQFPSSLPAMVGSYHSLVNTGFTPVSLSSATVSHSAVNHASVLLNPSSVSTLNPNTAYTTNPNIGMVFSMQGTVPAHVIPQQQASNVNTAGSTNAFGSSTLGLLDCGSAGLFSTDFTVSIGTTQVVNGGNVSHGLTRKHHMQGPILDGNVGSLL